MHSWNVNSFKLLGCNILLFDINKKNNAMETDVKLYLSLGFKKPCSLIYFHWVNCIQCKVFKVFPSKHITSFNTVWICRSYYTLCLPWRHLTVDYTACLPLLPAVLYWLFWHTVNQRIIGVLFTFMQIKTTGFHWKMLHFFSSTTFSVLSLRWTKWLVDNVFFWLRSHPSIIVRSPWCHRQR